MRRSPTAGQFFLDESHGFEEVTRVHPLRPTPRKKFPISRTLTSIRARIDRAGRTDRRLVQP